MKAWFNRSEWRMFIDVLLKLARYFDMKAEQGNFVLLPEEIKSIVPEEWLDDVIQGLLDSGVLVREGGAFMLRWE